MTIDNSRVPAIRVMGILNVTPDSFSDGGQFLDAQHAIEHGVQMAADGATIIDIGAESTRPGSSEVSSNEQLARLLPVVKGLRARTSLELSIDTRSARVAEACLDEGVSTVNDVSALYHDALMVKLLAKRDCRIILMHMRGEPE